MKSIKKISSTPAGKSVYSDDILEFHASRILLLIYLCGAKERETKQFKIDGLTKLAKLDFFIRYPKFFEFAASYLKKQAEAKRKDIESQMIRFHYGPWDERYYQLLPYLEAKNLITISKDRSKYDIRLTEQGTTISKKISSLPEFEDLVSDMKEVKRIFGKYTGSKLKALIYEIFGDEVAMKRLNESISYE